MLRKRLVGEGVGQMLKARVLGAALLAATCCASGCGDDSESDAAAPIDGHVPDTEKVPCPATIPEFVATPSGGLEVTGRDTGLVTAKLIDADYSPPRLFRNDWTV